MSRVYYLLIAFFLFQSAYAQDSITVSQADKLMSLGTHPGFTVDIPQARQKDVVNAWKKYIKRGETKNSVELEDDEYRMTGTTLVNISAQPMNVYAQIKEVEKAIRLTAFFTEDDSNFISSSMNPEKAQAAEKLLKDFARMQYHLAVENELNAETKKLADLEEEKEDLIKANDRAEKNINEYERKIDKTRTEIETNASEQGKRRSEVSNQKEVVRATPKNTETYDQEDKKLSSLEKELRKLEKENERMHSDIDGWNGDIRQQKRNIEKNDDAIKEKKEAISNQKDHVKEVKAKMERIVN